MILTPDLDVDTSNPQRTTSLIYRTGQIPFPSLSFGGGNIQESQRSYMSLPHIGQVSAFTLLLEVLLS